MIKVGSLSRPGGGATGWALQVQQRTEMTKAKLRRALQLYARLQSDAWIAGTPVDTSWMIQHYYAVLDGSIPPAEPRPSREAVPSDPSGSASRERIAPVIARFDAGHTLTLWNSAPYAPSVEYGTAKMAPRAWTRAAVARAPSLLAQAVAEARTEG